jgi:hypothetical protein
MGQNQARRATDKETVTPTRILTIEHSVEDLGSRVNDLKETIDINERKNETFQEAVLAKLDGKSDFNLQSTLKTVISTIAILGAGVTALGYYVESKIEPVKREGTHRDKAIISLGSRYDETSKEISILKIISNNTQKEVAGNSAFIDHYSYTAKIPEKIKILEKDNEMLQYRISKEEDIKHAR